MLTFFRKTRKGLLGEDAAPKPASPLGGYLLYAIGEITLVVIGILIALQINNWNEERVEHRQATGILHNINTEFEANKVSIESAIKRAKDFKDACIGVLRQTGAHFDNLSKGESDSLIFSGLSNFVTVELTDAVLEDLVSTGRIQLIRNDTLQRLLHEWEKAEFEVRESEHTLYSENSQIIIPFLIKNYSLASERRQRRFDFQSGFEHNHRTIYQLEEFENMAIRKTRLFDWAERDYEILLEIADSILTLTNRELMLQ
jgi:hypothetical protein